jgi:hypothetical protein
MANALRLTNAAVNAEADAFARLLDNGFLRIYSGTQPATADTALSGNTLLAELRFANPSAPAAVAGVLTFSAITSDTAADATGTATFFRAFKADGTTAVYDGSVGTSSADLVIDSTAIQVGADVDVTSLTHTVPKS